MFYCAIFYRSSSFIPLLWRRARMCSFQWENQSTFPTPNNKNFLLFHFFFFNCSDLLKLFLQHNKQHGKIVCIWKITFWWFHCFSSFPFVLKSYFGNVRSIFGSSWCLTYISFGSTNTLAIIIVSIQFATELHSLKTFFLHKFESNKKVLHFNYVLIRRH